MTATRVRLAVLAAVVILVVTGGLFLAFGPTTGSSRAPAPMSVTVPHTVNPNEDGMVICAGAAYQETILAGDAATPNRFAVTLQDCADRYPHSPYFRCVQAAIGESATDLYTMEATLGQCIGS